MKIRPLVIVCPAFLDLVRTISRLDSVAGMTLGPIIIARRELTEKGKMHEYIHVMQWLETSAAGTYATLPFFAFVWAGELPFWPVAILAVWSWLPGIGTCAAIHGFFWLLHRAEGHTSQTAYQLIPFEIEAYLHQRNPAYLSERKWFAWARRR